MLFNETALGKEAGTKGQNYVLIHEEQVGEDENAGKSGSEQKSLKSSCLQSFSAILDLLFVLLHNSGVSHFAGEA